MRAVLCFSHGIFVLATMDAMASSQYAEQHCADLKSRLSSILEERYDDTKTSCLPDQSLMCLTHFSGVEWQQIKAEGQCYLTRGSRYRVALTPKWGMSEATHVHPFCDTPSSTDAQVAANVVNQFLKFKEDGDDDGYEDWDPTTMKFYVINQCGNKMDYSPRIVD